MKLKPNDFNRLSNSASVSGSSSKRKPVMIRKEKTPVPPVIKALLTLIIITAAILAAGTIFAYAAKLPGTKKTYRKADPTPQKIISQSASQQQKLAAYTDFGQIRALSRPENGSSTGTVILIQPWFSYAEGDTELFEEISDKSRKIKSLFLEYFSAYTVSELQQKGEIEVKEDLRRMVNDALVLGRITGIYFDSYVFFQ